jgi:ectoine hydroxylase-related dioxygenase (phytanoyl-CoA dioxygenase family)
MSTSVAQANVDGTLVESYRRNGFVRVKGLIPREEALHFREVALRAAAKTRDLSAGSQIFAQFVNVWREDEEMRRLTLHPNVAAAAKQLSGVPLRLWHDQILIKAPGTSKSTEFHQDQPYWPHASSPNPISCWIALGDVPVEAGCMTFIAGQQHRTDLRIQNLADERSLFEIAPEMRWEPRVTLPLQAGDATFHHGRCPHMATPNLSIEPRVAHVAIFMDAGTVYTGAHHVVTDPLNLPKGAVLDHEMFPLA